MDRYALIASEFGFYLPDTAPVYQLMFLSETASKRRSDRQKAAKDGQVYVG